MDSQTESLSFPIRPDEHLGHKIYQPKNPEVIVQINKTVALFKKEIGPNAAKFVQLLILEERPLYSEFPQ